MSWDYDEKDIEKDVGAGFLEKSGCYPAKVISIEDKKTTNGYGQVVLKLEVEGKEVIIYHTYEGKEGLIDFKTRVLNHLLYINKLKNPADIGKCVGKNIGTMLKAKLSQDKQFINFDLEGVYHNESGRTASELRDNKPAKIVEAKRKQYEAEVPLKRVGSSTTTRNEETPVNVGDDDFPF